VKEIYSPNTGLLRMRHGEFAGSIHGEIHVHDELLQCASRHPGNQAPQGSVSFVADSRSLARWEHSPLVKGSLPNPIFHFQCVQRQIKKGRASQPAILRGGLLCPGLTGDEPEDQAAVGVGPPRLDCSRSATALTGERGACSASSSSSSIARARSASSASGAAGWMTQSGLPLSVTWTLWPERVRRFTLTGSRSRRRSGIDFIPSDGIA
jgi:hypothetical protein